MSEKGYCIDWESGPGCQIEFFGPKNEHDTYKRKYVPPLRSTIRPPVEDLIIAPETFEKINDSLTELVKKLQKRTRSDDDSITYEEDVQTLTEEIETLGQELHIYLMQGYVQADLDADELFLDIGIDEDLLNYPWELIFNGENYLSLKHFMGRYVISNRIYHPMSISSMPIKDYREKLKMLLISVPNPEPRIDKTTGEKIKYESLKEVKSETKEIVDCIDKYQGVELKSLIGKKATRRNVFKELVKGKYNLIHFSGHASYDDLYPYKSGLILHDRDMITGEILPILSQHPPLLCFINACETAKSADMSYDKNILNMFSLARAFLDTGTYLIGTRWKINDVTAKVFANTFYTLLINEEKTIGESILNARKACREKMPSDLLGWASYIYYGDPRIYFRKYE